MAVITQTVHPQNKRVRVTLAQLNAGYELLPALAGYAYRLIDWPRSRRSHRHARRHRGAPGGHRGLGAGR